MRAFEQKKKGTTTSDSFFSPKIQPKLKTGTVGDKYEVEADKVADKVVNKNATGGLLQSKAEEEVQQKPISDTISTVQKQELKDEKPVQKKDEKEEPVQKKEEEESVQKKDEKEEPVQKKEEEESVQKKDEKEEPVQKKEEEESVQKKEEKEEPVQKKEEEESVQKKEEKEEPVQKKEEEESVQKKEEKEEPVQKKGSETEVDNNQLESKLDNSKGKGTQLNGTTRQEMESGFGTDFSNVKIHTDTNAVEMTQELGAQAFTHGKDIYFNNGKFSPDSKDGKHLLAHELTHTVQQTGSKKIQMDKKTPKTQVKKKAKCLRKDEAGIMSGEFGRQLGPNAFYTEDNCDNMLTIKYIDVRKGEITGCNSIDVIIDGKRIKTLNPDQKQKKESIPLKKLKIGKHTITLTSPEYCMGFFKVNVTLK